MQFSSIVSLLSVAALAAATPVVHQPNRVAARAVATPKPTGNPSTGSAIVSAATAEEGQPYVFGGGGCAGPSSGGFDCSGLTQYAICQAMSKTIPRNSQAQYNAPGGVHLARASAQPGDLLFWTKNGDCSTGVVHVAIFAGGNEMINAPHTGTTVREQTVWTKSGGETICPDAVRFW